MTLEQKIKLTGDTSGLKEISRESRKAFNPSVIREFKREAKQLERDNISLSRSIIKLSRDMRGLEKGTDEFKAMRKEMRSFQQDAKLVETALGSIKRAMAKAPGSGSFIAGLGQGSGLAQYIPTGPGMGRRMAGAGIGGMARRGVQGGAAAFMTPGMGGMVNMLSALPGGGIAGGALQAASSYYQEAVGFQRQRLENLPYLSDISGRMGRSRAAAGRMASSTKMTDEARSRIIKEEIEGPMAEAETAITAERLHGQQGTTFSQHGRAVRMPSLQPSRAEKARHAGRTRYSAQQRGLKSAAKRIKREKELARSSIATAAAEGFGSVSGGAEAMGTRLGFMAGDVQQMIGGFMGTRGGERDDAAEGELREAVIARRRFGIGAEVSGGYGRMFQPGGGGTGQQSLSRTLGAAVAQGLKGVRINEYLQALVGLGRKAEQTGVKINISEFNRGTAGLTAMGLQGGQAGRIAGGIQEAAMSVSAKGVQSPMDLLMMRAAGWDPSQGAEGYFAASNKLAGGMNADMMQRLVGMITSGAAGGGPEQHVTMVRRAMGKMGIQVGPQQARKFIRSMEGGELTAEARSEFDAITGAGEGTEGRFLKEALGGSKRLGGAAITEAGLEKARIGKGAGYAGLMASMQRSTMASVDALGNFKGALTALSDTVTKFMKAIDKMLAGNFIEAMIGK